MRLFKALNALAQHGCSVHISDDWRRPHCFTVFFEMQSRYNLPPRQPFEITDGFKNVRATHETHTHTGFPGCTEEQGFTQLCEALENTAETIENYHKTKPVS